MGEPDSTDTEHSSAMNVCVCCRIRPLIASERRAEATEVLQARHAHTHARGRTHTRTQFACLGAKVWSFDRVFGATEDNGTVFDECVRPLVDRLTEGYNATVLAYGMTGSGKTYTMGNRGDAHEGAATHDTTGVIPRVFEHLFADSPHHSDTEIRLSYMEIYQEVIRDLLIVKRDPTTKAASARQNTHSGEGLHLRETARGDMKMSGLTVERIDDVTHAYELINRGAQNRTTAQTQMNALSSRSHAILTIYTRRKVPCEGGGVRYLHGKMHLVDLAGSERNKKTMAVGVRMTESVRINQGLLALGKVINALTKQQSRAMQQVQGPPAEHHVHVPYRESKLTRLLSDSLGGNAMTCMIACMSPADIHMTETINTLNYASKARLIRNMPKLNENDDAQVRMQGQGAHRDGGVDGSGNDHSDAALQRINELGEEEEGGRDDNALHRITIERLRARVAELEGVLPSGPGEAPTTARSMKPYRTDDIAGMVRACGEMLRMREAVLRCVNDMEALVNEAEAHRRSMSLSTRASSATALLGTVNDLKRTLAQASRIDDNITAYTALRRVSQVESYGGASTETSPLVKLATELQDKAYACEQRVRALESDLRACKDDLSRDEEIFAEKLKQIKELVDECQTLKTQNDTAQRDVRDLNARIQVLTRELAGARERGQMTPESAASARKRRLGELQDLIAKCNTTEREYEAFVDTCVCLSVEDISRGAVLEDLKAYEGTLTRESRRLHSAIEERRNLMHTLQESGTEADELVRKYTQRLTYLNNRKDALQRHMHDAQANDTLNYTHTREYQELCRVDKELHILLEQREEQRRVKHLRIQTMKRVALLDGEVNELARAKERCDSDIHEVRAHLEAAEEWAERMEASTQTLQAALKERDGLVAVAAPLDSPAGTTHLASATAAGASSSASATVLGPVPALDATAARVSEFLDAVLARAKHTHALARQEAMKHQAESERRMLLKGKAQLETSLDRSLTVHRSVSDLTSIIEHIQAQSQPREGAGIPSQDHLNSRCDSQVSERLSKCERERSRLVSMLETQDTPQHISEQITQVDDDIDALETEIRFTDERIRAMQTSRDGNQGGSTTTPRDQQSTAAFITEALEATFGAAAVHSHGATNLLVVLTERLVAETLAKENAHTQLKASDDTIQELQNQLKSLRATLLTTQDELGKQKQDAQRFAKYSHQLQSFVRAHARTLGPGEAFGQGVERSAEAGERRSVERVRHSHTPPVSMSSSFEARTVMANMRRVRVPSSALLEMSDSIAPPPPPPPTHAHDDEGGGEKRTRHAGLY